MTPTIATSTAVKIHPVPGLFRKDTEHSHRYYFTQDGDNLPAVGVTTVNDVLNKEALVGWAARMAVERVALGWEAGKVYQADEIAHVLEEAQRNFRDVSDRAKDAGTLAHDWIEAYWYGQELPMPVNPEANASCLEFLRWRNEHDVETLEVEFAVGNRDQLVAGTVDVVALVDGHLRIIDLKTGKRIYTENVIQVAKYHALLSTQVEGAPLALPLLLHIPKDGRGFEPVLFEDFRVKSGRGKKQTERPLTIEECVTVFDSLVPVYRGLKPIEKALNLWAKDDQEEDA